MIWVIIIVIAVVVVIAFKLGSTSGQVIGSVNNSGGMRVKYAKLLNNILSGHKDSKIFAETRTYIKHVLILKQVFLTMEVQRFSISNNLQVTKLSFNTK